MSITFSGLASGIDTDSIITEMMSLERAPIKQIESRKDDEKKRLEAFSQFKTRLEALRTAVSDMKLTSDIRTNSVNLSSDKHISATSSGSDTGNYDVAVAQLSQVQKSVSNGFESRTAPVLGTGIVKINDTEISVTADNNSLISLVESVNAQTDKTGVKASIINDGSGGDEAYRLVFTGVDSETSFTVDDSGLNGAEKALNVTSTQEAQQAVAFIDGIQIVSSTNTIKDAVSGLSIELNSVNSYSGGTPEAGKKPWEWADKPVYETTGLEIKADTDALKEKLTTFVGAYNSIMDWISSGYDEFGASRASVAGEDEEADEVLSSLVRGDSAINNAKRQLQEVLTDAVKDSGRYDILSEIGISTNRDGSLSQKNTKLDKALDEHYDDVVSLLAGGETTNGVMKKFNTLLLDLTSASRGVYATEKENYEDTIKSYNSQIDNMERRIRQRETTLRSQFSAMESLISQMNSQSSFLAQAFSSAKGDK